MRRAAPILIAALALGALAPLGAGSARAQDAAAMDAQIGRLTVSAVGAVEVPADEVQVQFSVLADAKTADAALTANQAKVEAMLAALHGIGLTEDETRTSNFTISPVYSGDGYRQGPIAGYQVNNAVLVRSKKLDIAGKAIQAAVNAGANNIDFVQFGLSGDQGRSEAITSAAKNARKDAEVLAAASSMRLGRVRQIALGGAERPFPNMVMARMEFGDASGGAPAPSLTPGTVRVQMTVTMEFEIHE